MTAAGRDASIRPARARQLRGRACLAAALALAANEAAAQSTAVQPAAQPQPPVETAVVVEEDAPRARPARWAVGALVGLVAGIFIVSMMVAGVN